MLAGPVWKPLLPDVLRLCALAAGIDLLMLGLAYVACRRGTAASFSMATQGIVVALGVTLLAAALLYGLLAALAPLVRPGHIADLRATAWRLAGALSMASLGLTLLLHVILLPSNEILGQDFIAFMAAAKCVAHGLDPYNWSNIQLYEAHMPRLDGGGTGIAFDTYASPALFAWVLMPQAPCQSAWAMPSGWPSSFACSPPAPFWSASRRAWSAQPRCSRAFSSPSPSWASFSGSHQHSCFWDVPHLYSRSALTIPQWPEERCASPG